MIFACDRDSQSHLEVVNNHITPLCSELFGRIVSEWSSTCLRIGSVNCNDGTLTIDILINGKQNFPGRSASVIIHGNGRIVLEKVKQHQTSVVSRHIDYVSPSEIPLHYETILQWLSGAL